MSDPQASPDPAARVARQSAVLQELTELGMRIARSLCEDAEAPSPDQPRRPAGDLALSFSRISRAVRQTLALEARLAEGPLGAHPADRRAIAPDPIPGFAVPPHKPMSRRDKVRQVVEINIDFDAPDDDIERLLDDLDERLADPADEARFADAPISVWIAAICQDFGLDPNWERWADEDWAKAEAATNPASPFARRPTGPPSPAPLAPLHGKGLVAERPGWGSPATG